MTNRSKSIKANEISDIHDFNIDVKNREIYIHSKFEDGLEQESGFVMKLVLG